MISDLLWSKVLFDGAGKVVVKRRLGAWGRILAGIRLEGLGVRGDARSNARNLGLL